MLLSFAGAFVASALTLSHYMGASLSCTVAEACEKVLTHKSATWLGLPVAVYGLLAYVDFIVLFSLMARPGKTRRQLWPVIVGLTGAGAAISMYLQYVALAVIGARCDWCLSSAAIMMAIFLGSIMLKSGLDDEEEVDLLRPMAIGGVAWLAMFGLVAVTLKQKNTNPVTSMTGLDKVKVSDVVSDPDKYAIGPKDAKITVVEFADIYCPGCRRSYADFHALLNSPKLSGKVRFIFRHYPLTGKEGHEFSDLAAMAVEYAAKQGKFQPVLDAFFTTDEEEIRNAAGIAKVLDSNGVSSAGFETELSKGAQWLIDAVELDKASADRVGVSATPTYLVFAEGLPTRSADHRVIIEMWDRPEYANLLKK